MTYTTSLLLLACLIPNNTHTSLPKFLCKTPEQKILKAFTKENPQKAEKLLRKYPRLAQLQTENGWTLAHYAAASLSPALLQLAVKHGADFLREDTEKRLPIELTGQFFMRKCLENSKTEQTVRNHFNEPVLLSCSRSTLQDSFYEFMTILTEESMIKSIEACYKIVLGQYVSIDIQQIIFAMAPSRHIYLSTLWLENNADQGVAFLEACPLPSEYFKKHGSNLPDKKWYKNIVGQNIYS